MERRLLEHLQESVERAQELSRTWAVVSSQCAYYRGRADALAELVTAVPQEWPTGGSGESQQMELFGGCESRGRVGKVAHIES